MSAAKPMDVVARMRGYKRQTGLLHTTPRQRSRIRHKTRRRLTTFLAGDGVYPGDWFPPGKSPAKGRRTPRRHR